jgi:26S proteasome regulatory subunit N2
MAPYLPQHGSSGGGSPYSEGGALYALGLIHANHGEGIKEFLRESLCSTNVEIIQHGACLGLGLAALGTADEEIYKDVKDVLYTDNAIAGEAAGISMGLLMVGTASEKASEMLAYAHDTQYEKIIGGLALGIALTVYGREEEADTLIEQMTRDQDPILRYGGMYARALAYRGTSNNKAIRRLLHFAVSDVSDDVRRTAVLALGFILYSEPEPDNVSFLHSPENERLDDDRMLDSISEQLSYDEFASDG